MQYIESDPLLSDEEILNTLYALYENYEECLREDEYQVGPTHFQQQSTGPIASIGRLTDHLLRELSNQAGAASSSTHAQTPNHVESETASSSVSSPAQTTVAASSAIPGRFATQEDATEALESYSSTLRHQYSQGHGIA